MAKADSIHRLWKRSTQKNYRVDATLDGKREDGIPVLNGKDGIKGLDGPEKAKALLDFRTHETWGRYCFNVGEVEVMWGE